MLERLRNVADGFHKRALLGWSKEELVELWNNGTVQRINDTACSTLASLENIPPEFLKDRFSIDFDFTYKEELQSPKISYICGPFPPKEDFFSFAQAELRDRKTRILIDISDQRRDLPEEGREDLTNIDIRRIRPIYGQFGNNFGVIFVPKNVEEHYNGLDAFLITYLGFAIGGRIIVPEDFLRVENGDVILHFGHRTLSGLRPIDASSKNTGDFDFAVNGIPLRPYFMAI